MSKVRNRGDRDRDQRRSDQDDDIRRANRQSDDDQMGRSSGETGGVGSRRTGMSMPGSTSHPRKKK